MRCQQLLHIRAGTGGSSLCATESDIMMRMLSCCVMFHPRTTLVVRFTPCAASCCHSGELSALAATLWSDGATFGA